MDKLKELLDNLRKGEVGITSAETIILLLNIIRTQDVRPEDGLSLAGAFNRLDSVELHAAISSLLSMIVALKNNAPAIRDKITDTLKAEEQISDEEITELLLQSLW